MEPDLPLDEIERLRALEKAATPGNLPATGEFVAVYMNAAPALLDMAAKYLRLREAAQTGHVGALCEILGHRMIDDHCGKPEHRYCLRCDATSEEAVARERWTREETT